MNLHADSVRRPLPGIGDEAFYWTYGFHASNSPRPRKVVWPQISLMERVMPEKPEVGLVMRACLSREAPPRTQKRWTEFARAEEASR